jgi:phosphate:Na+ symporter
MAISVVISLLSGVALFLFGMSLMGENLKKVAGNKLEDVLYKLTNTPIKGILLGAIVTAIIQSSSATTVMVVGFVNSGMMKVAQSIGIIMGANIGTSITGWILCLSYIEGSEGIAQLLSATTISAVIAVVGIVLKMFVKKANYRNLGNIMLGFSILMVGMQTMSGAVAPLKDNPKFLSALTMFSNPVMGIIVGILFTAVLQSASASVGILQALSVTGSITFATALPITMGIGVGAACPVLLSSIGTSKDGKRTALIYLLNDLFGMVFWSIVFYTANAFVKFPFMDMTMTPIRIALLNTLFRAATIAVLVPFIKYIEKIVCFLVKDSDEDKDDQADFDLLKPRFLGYPDLAISQTQRAINGMAAKLQKNIFKALRLLDGYSEEIQVKVIGRANVIDQYEDKLGRYMMQMTERNLSADQRREISKYLYCISDFGRMCDCAVDIANVAKEMHEKNVTFSDEANYEIGVIRSAVNELVDLTVKTFTENDINSARRIEPLRELINTMCEDVKSRHVSRLSDGKCELDRGFAFNNLLTLFERISAHCSNVATAEFEAYSDGEAHYLKGVQARRDPSYINCFKEYEEKYIVHGYKEKNEKSFATVN